MKNIQSGIIVTTKELKKNLLVTFSDTLKVIRIYDTEEFLSLLTFTYQPDALVYLKQKYGIPCDKVKEIISYLRFVKAGKTGKLAQLYQMYEDLKQHNLLQFTPNFYNYIETLPLYFYGFHSSDNTLKRIKELVSPLKFIELEMPSRPTTNVVHGLNSLEDEITYVVHQIGELIASGVSPNSIKIVNANQDYYSTLKRIFKSYAIPLNLPSRKTLNQTPIGTRFIELIKTNTAEDTIALLLEEFGAHPLINSLIDIVNSYALCLDSDFLIYEVTRTSVPAPKLDNAVELIEVSEISEDFHYFVVNVNYTFFPRISKDVSYLNDELKEEIGYPTTKQINEEEYRLCKYLLTNFKLTLTYKLTSYTQTYAPSDLIKELGLQVEEIDQFNHSVSYSRLNDAIRLTRYYDNANLNPINQEFVDLNANLSIGYKGYDHNYKGISQDVLDDYFAKKPLKLSYTSLDKYYRCAFSYYLSYILKLDPYQPSLSQKIGNLFHDLLQKAYSPDFDFESAFQEHMDTLELTPKENFFLLNLKDELSHNINYIMRNHQKSKLQEVLLEYPITLDFSNNRTFVGTIDKIVYGQIDGQTIAYVVDYKTGNTELKPTFFPAGYNLQLPIYMYLLKRSNKLGEVKVVGFYYQKMIVRDDNLDNGTRHDDLLKLDGYSLDSLLTIEQIDPDVLEDGFIKGIRVKKDGDFHANARVMSQEQLDDILSIVDEKINSAFEKIEKGEFPINPLMDGNKLIGCKYCKYHVICFKDALNYREMEENEYDQVDA